MAHNTNIYAAYPNLPPALPKDQITLRHLRDTLNRPRYTTKVLIAAAIRTFPDRAATADAIYTAIQTKFPWYEQTTEWRETVRHDLSFWDMFMHIPRPEIEPGRGDLWIILEDVDPRLHKGEIATSRSRKKPSAQKKKEKKDSEKAKQSAQKKGRAKKSSRPRAAAPTPSVSSSPPPDCTPGSPSSQPTVSRPLPLPPPPPPVNLGTHPLRGLSRASVPSAHVDESSAVTPTHRKRSCDGDSTIGAAGHKRRKEAAAVEAARVPRSRMRTIVKDTTASVDGAPAQDAMPLPRDILNKSRPEVLANGKNFTRLPRDILDVPWSLSAEFKAGGYRSSSGGPSTWSPSTGSSTFSPLASSSTFSPLASRSSVSPLLSTSPWSPLGALHTPAWERRKYALLDAGDVEQSMRAESSSQARSRARAISPLPRRMGQWVPAAYDEDNALGLGCQKCCSPLMYPSCVEVARDRQEPEQYRTCQIDPGAQVLSDPRAIDE